MSKFAKTLVTLIVCTTLTNTLCAQENSDRAYFESCLKNNIESLDPIEGLYYFDYQLDVYSAYAGHETVKQHMECVILKLEDTENGKTTFFIHSYDGDAKGLVGDIQKLGDSGFYLFRRFDSQGNGHKTTIKLKDSSSFVVEEENNARTAKSQSRLIAIKIFPTRNMCK